ncbi:hypothetical protein KR009_010885 [Drosophila setifemur]|nr:hypothetical protein KR009_010885 [Drosophila setifemur]
MPNKTEESGDSHPMKRHGRQRRKPTIWTREKISKLIELYRSSDCLWNHYSELYKNKDCRSKAIDHICVSLGITKNDYGKKVHNLRNQFNSELKKLERRLEESGGSSPSAEKTCRWEHFKTLMFLRSVIEPRPGYQQISQATCKKMMTKLEYSFTEKDVEKHSQSSVDSLESIIIETATEGDVMQKISEPIATIADLSQPSTSCNGATCRLVDVPVVSSPAPTQILTGSRDQWDAFGELIANEFRNLNSEVSRKRLKRRIMLVMLEVGEEDDLEFAGKNN